MRKPVVPSTTKTNWVSIKTRLDSALDANKVKSSTKVSKKVTSVTHNAQSVAEKFKANQIRIINGDPLFESKRKEGLKKYWEERRKKKASTQAVEQYRDRNGLRTWSMLMPLELHTAFKAYCRKHRIPMCSSVCELILEFITKPDSTKQ